MHAFPGGGGGGKIFLRYPGVLVCVGSGGFLALLALRGR